MKTLRKPQQINARHIEFVIHAAQRVENRRGFYGVRSLRGAHWCSSGDRCALVLSGPEFSLTNDFLEKIGNEIELTPEDDHVFSRIPKGEPMGSVSFDIKAFHPIASQFKAEAFPYLRLTCCRDKDDPHPEFILMDMDKRNPFIIRVEGGVFPQITDIPFRFFQQMVKSWPETSLIKMQIQENGDVLFFNEEYSIFCILEACERPLDNRGYPIHESPNEVATPGLTKVGDKSKKGETKTKEK